MSYLDLMTEIEDFISYKELTNESTIGELLDKLGDAFAEE